ncbi:aladin-like isoform X2 [Oscarella lobularis]
MLEILLERIGNDDDQQTAMTKIRSYLVNTLSLLRHLSTRFTPELSDGDMLASFVQTSQWRDSEIRAIAWHPDTAKIAVGAKNDIVRVYEGSSERSISLKHRNQKSISCLAWRPLCKNELAVGCLSGIVLWHLDPNIARPSANSVQFLSRPGHSPIVDLTWSPWGKYLASSSPADRAMMIWEVSRDVATPTSQLGGGIGVIRWAPCGTHLFAATTSSLFRVWETRNWTCEKWSNMSNRCNCGCWSSDGQAFIFSISGEASIYCLRFVQPGDDVPAVGSKVCVKCVDLTPHTFTFNSQSETVGGAVQSLAWDPTNQRLAIILTADSPGSELVVICRTRVYPTVEIVPYGFIRGPDDYGYPSCIAFQNDFKSGALLTVGWTRGRVSYVPLYFHASGHTQSSFLEEF